MSIARHHNEWLGLVEQSGPFLSVPVLMESDVFSTGLDPHDPELFRQLRVAYDEWRDQPHDLYGAWIEFVLHEVLGFNDTVLRSGQSLPVHARVRIAEHGESIVPDYALVNPDGDPHKGKLRLLVRTVPVGQDLDKPLRGKTWKASPNTRMVELLHATDTHLGLVTNGEDWTLVHAPRGETSGFAAWKADLWCEESITLRAFRSLLTFKRFFGVAEKHTIESLYEESAKNQQEVTDQLGLQVRHAVEILVSRLDRLDQDNGRDLLRHVEEKRVYESALTIMMRLVFLMCAEERGLFPMDEPIYAQHYAVTTLRDALDDVATKHGEEVLERRHDAWVRLLALFRLIYGGSNDDRLRIVAYGGGLFDPDRFSFLEGRMPGTTWRDTPAHPLPVDNRTVLHLLKALQVLQINGEARRLSFRALDIEQIGHVYEGLLDHTAIRALPGRPVLGLQGTAKKEPEVELATLEKLRAESDEKLITFLTEESGRSDGALWNSSTKPKSTKKRGRKKAAPAADDLFNADDAAESDDQPVAWPITDHAVAGKLLAACNGDQALYRRILPFAGLIRTDTFGNPVVIPGGAIYVTQGTDRRSTGTHYTPRSLTEPIVQYTLEPLVYIGPAEGLPKEEWKLRSPRELLDLKICDMAMGSGAFLVQACRYMSERLVESWELAEREAFGVQREAGSVERDEISLQASRTTHHDITTHHAPRATSHDKKGSPDGGSVVSRTGSLAAGDESGGAVLPPDEDLPEGGTLRDDQPDSPGRSIDSSKHRGGTRPSAHEGVSELPGHSAWFSDGVGDSSSALPEDQSPHRIAASRDSATLRASEPDAHTAQTGPSKESGREALSVEREVSSVEREAWSGESDEVSINESRTTHHDTRSTHHASRPTHHDTRPTHHDTRSTLPAPRTTITFPYADPITGRISERPLPADADERLALARRAIAERCLYGVDKNPLAVEIAKLSLWLITLDKGRPFTFVDHALKAGDSLLGVRSAEQIRFFHIYPDIGKLTSYDWVNRQGKSVVQAIVAEATRLRSQIESFVVQTPYDNQAKLALLQSAEKETAKLRLIGDLLIAAAISTASEKNAMTRMKVLDGMISSWLLEDLQFAFDEKEAESTRVEARNRIEGKARQFLGSADRQLFHWPLEFPEVFGTGFDAFVGNPPFQGGQKITGAIGTDYRDYLVEYVAHGQRGSADLCSYFFLRAHALLCEGGHTGLIATNTIAQGDTREVGLEQLTGAIQGQDLRDLVLKELGGPGTILKATSSRKWPGVANLEIAEVWWRKSREWKGSFILDGKNVKGITPFLTVPGRALGKPHRLLANEGKSFIGSYVLGMGFVMEPEEAQALIAKDPRNRDVLFPYLNGEDLNSRPDQSSSRWVINFKDWPLERGASLRPLWRDADEKERKRYLQRGIVPADYGDPVARDYPDCIEIVERLVKPEREALRGRNSTANGRADAWWRYGRHAPNVYEAIRNLPRVFVGVQTSKYVSISLSPADIVFSHMTVVFASDRYSTVAVLCASWHTDWVDENCSKLETRLRYIPTDGFETFPFPASLNGLDAIGERYHEHRRQVMLARQEGLTKTYNRFHNPKETSDDIQTLRDLHVEMDRAVLDAYRQSPGEAHIWEGFGPDDLEHGFHETKQGLRFTVSEYARRELLDRLLELNHKRYQEEVAAGLHDKKKGKAAKAKATKKKAAAAPPKVDPDDLFSGGLEPAVAAEVVYTPPKDRQQALMALLLHLVRFRPGLSEEEYLDALGDAMRIQSHVAALSAEQQDTLQELLPQIPAQILKQKPKVRFRDIRNALNQFGYLSITKDQDGTTRRLTPNDKDPDQNHGWLLWPVADFADLVFAVSDAMGRERDAAEDDLVERDLEMVEV